MKKNSLMLMVGCAAGIGAYISIQNMMKNKNQIKRSVNKIVDNTAEMF